MKKLTSKLVPYFLMSLILCIWKMPVQASDINTFAPVFNSTYYAEKYEDVSAAYGSDDALLFHHFLTSGIMEGRQGSQEFDVQVYRNNYADLNAAFGDNLMSYYLHYINSGKAEGRVAAASSSTQDTPTPPENSGIHATFTEEQLNFINRVLELVNQERTAQGLNPITATNNLSDAAHARAMEISDYYSHTRPNGESCFTVLKEYNVGYQSCGENIAAGQRTPEEVVTDWMNSPGHRANILRDNFKHLGVGYYKVPSSFYGTYWVQLFIG